MFGWSAIARYNHTRRWRILLEMLELPVYNNRAVPRDTVEFMVNIRSDYDIQFRD